MGTLPSIYLQTQIIFTENECYLIIYGDLEAGIYEKGGTKITPHVCGKIKYPKILKCTGYVQSLVRDVYLCVYIDNTYTYIHMYVYVIMYK